jgi:hypothetical protein
LQSSRPGSWSRSWAFVIAYGGAFTRVVGTGNHNFVPSMNGFFWVTIGLIVAGGMVGLAGSVVQLVAWVGGLVNSYGLPEKTWFLILLLGGLLSIAFALVRLRSNDYLRDRRARRDAAQPSPGSHSGAARASRDHHLRCHRVALWRDTRSRRATSAGQTP